MTTRLESLRAKRGQLVDEMEAIIKAAEADERELSDDENAALAVLRTSDDRVAEAIKAEEDVLARKAALAKPVNLPDGLGNPPVKAAAVRHGKIKNFRGPDAEANAYRSGQWALAALFGRDDSREWCRENGVAIVKAAGEGTNSLGGFLVPVEFENAIIDLREEYGLARQMMNQHPMSSESVTIPRRDGGLTAYPVGENSLLTESDATWSQVELVARKWGVLTRISSELQADAAINVADRLVGEIAYAFAVAEDGAAFAGDGTSTYHGITGVLTALLESGNAGSVYTATSGVDTFAELTLTEFHGLIAKLPKYAKKGARWQISEVGFELAMQRLAAAAGGNTFRTLKDGSTEMVFLGYPVDTTQSYPVDSGDISDTIMCTFGRMDLAGTMGTRSGVGVATATERYFEYDQIGIRGTERFDANWHDLGSASAAGPLVGLKAN